MKVRQIVEAEVSLPDFIDYLRTGGTTSLGPARISAYAAGDTVLLDKKFPAQKGIALVVDVLPHDEEVDGDQRRYSVRYADEHGNIRSTDVSSAFINGIVRHSLRGPLAKCLLGDEDMPDQVRPVTYLLRAFADVRRTGALDTLVRGEDEVANLEAFEEAEQVAERLARLVGVRS